MEGVGCGRRNFLFIYLKLYLTRDNNNIISYDLQRVSALLGGFCRGRATELT
jgi:hypothetical protein